MINGYPCVRRDSATMRSWSADDGCFHCSRTPLAFAAMNIEITPKKTDGLERLIEVKVPVETVRDAEDKAARAICDERATPGLPSGQGAAGDGQEAIQGRDPAAGHRDARAGGVSGSHGPREAQGRVAAARARPQVRGRPAAQLRAARRGAPGDRARAHAGLPRHAPQTAGHRRAACASRSSRCATRKRRGRRSRTSRRRATWCACSSRRPKRTASSPRRASIRSSSAAARRSPASKS